MSGFPSARRNPEIWPTIYYEKSILYTEKAKIFLDYPDKVIENVFFWPCLHSDKIGRVSDSVITAPR